MRHHIGRPQEPGTQAQPVDTISASLEQISTSIEALRKAIATQQEQSTISARDGADQFHALLLGFRHSLPFSRTSVTIPAQLTLPLAGHNVRIAMKFARAGVNTGVQMTIADQAANTIYDTNLPWPDLYIRFVYPQAQWGSAIKRIVSASQVNQQITFQQAFEEPPSVRCWLTGFETTGLALRARVQTSQITATGFMLHVEPPTLLSVGITWLGGLSDSQVGQFTANQSGMWAGASPPAIDFTGTSQGLYTGLAVAITQVDIGGTPAFPVTLQPLLVRNENHFTWTIKAGPEDKGLYLLNGVFMAMYD